MLLKEGTSQTKGMDALKNNVGAAKPAAAVLKPVPDLRGMYKLLVDSLGKVKITNDGATILKEMDVQRPAAKIIVEISKTVDDEVGDGKTSVIIAGARWEKSQEICLHALKRNRQCFNKLL